MSTLPKDIAELFEELRTEITWLHGRWIIYRQLFGKSKARIDLLNECASNFFYIVHDVLLGEIKVSLTKLTEPDKKSLSLEQLQRRVEARGGKQLISTLRKLLDELHGKCQPFIAWRNKRLAHLDLNTALRVDSNSLPDISRQMIEDAMHLMREYMNTIERHYCNDPMGYEYFWMNGDGEALISMLKYGISYKELFQDGKISLDDFLRGKWRDA